MILRAGRAGAVILAIAFGGHASAQEAVKGEKIEVTGSNIKRVDGETGLPVQVITAEDMRRGGVQNVQDLLERVSANQSAGAFNDSRGLGNSSGGWTSASLRGLGADRTLVLLNGRRLAPYALSFGDSIDVSQIPFSAIERVEVLKDGASAVYGTDAIGGVINFILRKDFNGVELGASAVEPQQTGGASWRANATAGYGRLDREGYNVFATLDYMKQDSLRAADRAVSRTAYLPDLGLDLTSQNSYPANIQQPGRFSSRSPALPCLPPLSFPTERSPLQCRFDYASIIDTIPETEKATAFVRYTQALGADHQFFAEASRYHGKQLDRISPTLFRFADGNTLTPGSPYYPTAFVAQSGGDVTRPVQVAYRAVELGPRVDDVITDQDRVVVGLQGAIRDWDYQAGLLYTTNRDRTAAVSGEVRASAFHDLFQTGVVNPFAPNSDEVVARMRDTSIPGKTADSRFTIVGADGKASSEVMNLAHGPLAVAFGFEAKRENMSITNEPVVVNGDIMGFGGPIPSVDGVGRRVFSLYGEVNGPVARGLEVNLAVRADHYSDFGSTVNPKLTLRWLATEGLLARASAGTGFRAPSLVDLFLPDSTGFVDGVVDPVRCPVTGQDSDCQGTTLVKTGGNTTLQPEKSRQANVGLVFESRSGFSASLDYYWVRVTDLIGTPPLSVDPAHVVRGPPDADYPNLAGPIVLIVNVTENQGTLQSSGLDVDLRYRFPSSELGRVSMGLNGTYVLTYKPAQENLVFPASPGHAGPSGGAISRWRHYASIDWNRGPWGATLAQNFQAGHDEPDLTTCDADGLNCADRHVGSYSIWDAQVRYDFSKNASLSFGVRNVFGHDPPRSSQSSSFQAGYDPSYADPRGRMFLLSARYAFK